MDSIRVLVSLSSNLSIIYSTLSRLHATGVLWEGGREEFVLDKYGLFLFLQSERWCTTVVLKDVAMGRNPSSKLAA